MTSVFAVKATVTLEMDVDQGSDCTFQESFEVDFGPGVDREVFLSAAMPLIAGFRRELRALYKLSPESPDPHEAISSAIVVP